MFQLACLGFTVLGFGLVLDAAKYGTDDRHGLAHHLLLIATAHRKHGVLYANASAVVARLVGKVSVHANTTDMAGPHGSHVLWTRIALDHELLPDDSEPLHGREPSAVFALDLTLHQVRERSHHRFVFFLIHHAALLLSACSRSARTTALVFTSAPAFLLMRLRSRSRALRRSRGTRA